MKNMRPFFSSIVACVSIFAAAHTSRATLIGNSVTATTGLPYFIATPGSTVVGAGSEFALYFSGSLHFFDIDIDANSIRFDWRFTTTPFSLGAAETVTISGLGSTTDSILGFSLLTSGTSGIDSSDITFTNHSISFDLDHGSTWTGGSFATIQLQMSPNTATAPEPTSTIALLAFALPIGAVLRRRISR